MKTLIVEDEPLTRQRIEAGLAPLGHDVTAVESAEEALALLESVDFGIGIVDWMLPGMPGPELCARIRTLRAVNRTRYV